MKGRLVSGTAAAVLGLSAVAAGVTLNTDFVSAAYGGPPGASCAQFKAFNDAGWNTKAYFQNKYGANWEAKYNDRANEPYEQINSTYDLETGKVTTVKESKSLMEWLGDKEFAEEGFDMISSEYAMLSESCAVNVVVPAGKELGISALTITGEPEVVISSTSGNTITIEEGAELDLGGLSPLTVESKSASGVAILNRGTLVADSPSGGVTTIKSAGKYAIITGSDIELGSNVSVNGKIAYVTSSEDSLANDLVNKLSSASAATGISQADLAKIQAAVDAGEILSVDLRVEGTGTEDISNEESTLINTKVGSDGTVAGYFDIDVVVTGSVSGVLGNLTEIDMPLSVTLTIPATYQENADTRNWYVVRIHDGEVEKVTGSLTEVWSEEGYVWAYTFQTDKFSTYALVSEPKTEEEATADVAVPNSGVSTKEAGSIASVSATVMALIASAAVVLGARAYAKSRK